MIDVQEVLRMKENDIIRVRKEIDALQLVAKILSDEVPDLSPNGHSDEVALAVQSHMVSEEFQPHEGSNGQALVDDETLSQLAPKRSILRDWFNQAAGE